MHPSPLRAHEINYYSSPCPPKLCAGTLLLTFDKNYGFPYLGQNILRRILLKTPQTLQKVLNKQLKEGPFQVYSWKNGTLANFWEFAQLYESQLFPTTWRRLKTQICMTWQNVNQVIVWFSKDACIRNLNCTFRSFTWIERTCIFVRNSSH